MFKLEPDCVTVDTVLCRRIRRTLRLAGGPGPPSQGRRPSLTKQTNSRIQVLLQRRDDRAELQNQSDESFVTSARDRKA